MNATTADTKSPGRKRLFLLCFRGARSPRMAIYRMRGMQWVQGSESGVNCVNSEVHQKSKSKDLDFFISPLLRAVALPSTLRVRSNRLRICRSGKSMRRLFRAPLF